MEIILLFFGLILFLPFGKSISKYYIDEFWLRSFDFKGKTKRRIFWIGNLIWLYVTFNLNIIFLAVRPPAFENNIDGFIALITGIHLIVSLIPHISIEIRRINDIGKPRIYFLFWLIPLIGPLILAYLYSYPSDARALEKERIKKITFEDKLIEIDNLLQRKLISKEENSLLRKKLIESWKYEMELSNKNIEIKNNNIQLNSNHEINTVLAFEAKKELDRINIDPLDEIKFSLPIEANKDQIYRKLKEFLKNKCKGKENLNLLKVSDFELLANYNWGKGTFVLKGLRNENLLTLYASSKPNGDIEWSNIKGVGFSL